MRYSVSSLMDEIWERAVETALDGEKDHASARTLTLDGAVKCIQGRLPPPSLLEKFQNLQHLSIASIGVSSLEQFPKLLKLERLILSDNRIAGGLEFLVEAGLDSLRDLDLSNNRIQHIEDLAPLAQLKLVSLDLYECPVTRVKDYRSRVFKLIESLKYLDKMDLQEKERPESEEEEEDEDDNEDEEEEEEEDEDPGSGEIDGEDRQFVECNGHGEGVGGVVNVDEEEEIEAGEEEDGDGSNRVPNGRVRVEHMEEDGGGENDSGEEIDDDDDDDDDDEDFNIDDIRDHFVEVHQVVESDDDEENGIEYDEDDDEDDDDDDDESDDDDDEMGIGNIAQVEFPFDEPLPDTRGLFIDMSGEIDGHEHGEEDGDGDNNGETGEEEIGIEYDPEFEDDDDEEEDLGAGYLVQPVIHSEALNAGINGGNNDEEEEEIDDNDSDDAQVLPPSSSNLKRKRDDDGDEQ